MALEFKDETKMPFGEHKGKSMADIPDDYLRWFWDKNKEEYLNDEIKYPSTVAIMKYIEDNLDSIDVDE